MRIYQFWICIVYRYISQIEELKSGNKDQKRENNEQKAKIEDLNKRNEELTKVCKELKEESEKLKNKLETEGGNYNAYILYLLWTQNNN